MEDDKGGKKRKPGQIGYLVLGLDILSQFRDKWTIFNFLG